VNDDQLLDLIPIEDIIGIDELAAREGTAQLESAMETTVDFSNSFRVKTKPDGYNAGRSYLFRADGNVASLIQGIVLVSKAAERRANARFQWANVQDRARILYTSRMFQGGAAFLIIAVRKTLS
jgi:hypothetical protein